MLAIGVGPDREIIQDLNGWPPPGLDWVQAKGH
jgi:hypothetical protein